MIWANLMIDHRRVPHTLLALACFLTLFVPPARPASSGLQLTTTEKQLLQREARLVVDLLQNLHYSGRAFREIENKEMITRFLEELDPKADYLTPEDRDFIHRRFDKTLKSVYLFRGDLQPAFEIFDLFAERARVRLDWVTRRLTQNFDLDVDETYSDPLKPAATSPAAQAADQHWEQQLKDQLIREIVAGRTETDAIAAVAKNHRELGKRIAASDSFMIRERFFDAIIRSFDPHSGYFSADSTREFAIDMENAVSGLGLDLRKDEGRCIVTSVQPGGPADLYSDLGPGDILVALAAGEEAWTDASSLRLREIVGRLRGEPGSAVRLAYLPIDTTERVEVKLERARVVLPAARVHGAISDVPDPTGQIRHIGWIILPSFYAGGEGADATSAARDLRELLDQMVAQQIDGLVLDLRANPGGALTEAAAISEFFLPGGCMMLSRGPTGQITEHKLNPGSAAYTGPLVLLTSAQSASASEILAGALKFHRRALVVGGATTFGKSTAQSYVQLAKLPGVSALTAKDWGTLRLTYERFYLPDGGAVQRAGVASHIVLPDFDPPDFEREAALPHALPEESITPRAGAPGAEAAPSALSDSLLQFLGDQAVKSAELPEWKLWRTERRDQQQQFARISRSLRLATRQREWEETLCRFRATAAIRRPLAATAAFPTRPIEIARVQAAYAAHEARLRAAEQPLLHHLRRGEFFIETDQGRLRELRLESLGVAAYYGDAETLATAFGAAACHPLSPRDARRILEAISLLERKTDKALLAEVGRITGGKCSTEAVRHGTEALLQRLTELDPELRRERPALDIPLREAQRLAAAWAGWRPNAHLP